MRLKDKIAIITGAGRGMVLLPSPKPSCAKARWPSSPNAISETGLATASRSANARSSSKRRDRSTLSRGCHRHRTAALRSYRRSREQCRYHVFHEPLETSDAEWQRCMAVDLEGVWRMCRAVLPSLLEGGGGSIVNIASSHSSTIIPGTFPYPVAKHAFLV